MGRTTRPKNTRNKMKNALLNVLVGQTDKESAGRLNTDVIIDLGIPKNVELLQAALLAAFPDANGYLYPTPQKHAHGVTLGYRQAAWSDDSWGWEPKADCPARTSCIQPEYKQCPMGGRFVRDSYRIGD